jgi:NitT/TauT family transport system substrate-binding protein
MKLACLLNVVSFGLLTLSGLLISGCNQPDNPKANVAAQKSEPSPNGSAKDKVVLQLNWYPEAEHGGFYAAKVHGIFDKYNLDVEILPGGRSSTVPQELTIGRIQFGIINADELLLARQEGVDIVSLMAPLQTSPRCLLVRADSGIKGFDQLSGLTLQLGAGQPFIEFLKSKGYLENVKIVPYQGSVAGLVAGTGVGQQAYVFSEPLLAEQQNVPVTALMVSDTGFNPYTSLLAASTEYTNTHKDLVSRMVKASKEGWQKYLESPDETNKFIITQNEHGLTAEALTYGVEKMKPLCINEEVKLDSVGKMAANRWEELVKQMTDLKLIDPSKVTASQCFRADFLD